MVEKQLKGCRRPDDPLSVSLNENESQKTSHMKSDPSIHPGVAAAGVDSVARSV